jgi:hypothetical protein
VTVLAMPQTPTSLSVRWPGGHLTTHDIPAGATKVAVDFDGKLERIR